jgi:outer membrane protein insertion porin family
MCPAAKSLATLLVVSSVGSQVAGLGVVRAAPRQTSLSSYHLARIEIAGLRTLSASGVLAMCGLRVNTLVTQRDVEAASARLLDSGMFSTVSHRYRMQGYGLIVTFVVEEASWSTPIVFDNFVGYTDQQLTDAIAARVPFFHGTAPESPAILGRIASAAQAFVRAADPSATVTYLPAAETPSEPRRYRLVLERAGQRPSICAVDLRGLPAEQLEEARAKSASLIGADYSRDFISQHARLNVLPVCHRDGRYLANVTSVSAQPVSLPGCAGGVAVTVEVDPGPRYTWGSIDWLGAKVIAPEELAASVGIKAGDLADIDRLDHRLELVTTTYRRTGYLAIRIMPAGRVSEGAHTVACRVNIVEGPRFRFRSIALTGLDAGLESRILARWTLAPGQFYDGTYLRQFIADIREAEREALADRTSIAIRERPDLATLMVDVVLEFSRPGSPLTVPARSTR